MPVVSRATNGLATDRRMGKNVSNSSVRHHICSMVVDAGAVGGDDLRRTDE
jgi:hypothetical protein